VKRSDIYWCRLDPIEGSEMSKTRPCVIVSLDALNKTLPTVVVCPLTSTIHKDWRTRIKIDCVGQRAEICADQIRSVSKSRLGKKIGAISRKEASALFELLTEMYGQP
jgi:mRNA interferase MazF